MIDAIKNRKQSVLTFEAERENTGMSEKPFAAISDQEAFEKFTKGTPATTTDGQQVQILSDSYIPVGQEAQDQAKAYFSPEPIPLADYLNSAGGDEQLHHRVFRTIQPGVYYTEVELLKKDGRIVPGVGGYRRPWDEESHRQDLAERNKP